MKTRIAYILIMALIFTVVVPGSIYDTYGESNDNNSADDQTVYIETSDELMDALDSVKEDDRIVITEDIKLEKPLVITESIAITGLDHQTLDMNGFEIQVITETSDKADLEFSDLNIQGQINITDIQPGDDGGINVEHNKATIINSSITNNITQKNGGGIITSATDIRIYDSSFINNIAGENGGAIWSSTGSILMVNNTFVDNHADGIGGAVYSSGNITAINNTFVNNSAGICNSIYSTGNVEMFGNIVMNNNSNNDIFSEGQPIDLGTIGSENNYNIAGNKEGYTMADVFGSDSPVLSSAFINGTTKYFVILGAVSPAIDAIPQDTYDSWIDNLEDADSVKNMDIRYKLRPDADNEFVDIGSMEVQKPDSIAITADAFTIVRDDKTNAIVKDILPDDCDKTSPAWISSDPNIASIDKNGTVTGKEAGKATITAVHYGARDSFQITVLQRNLIKFDPTGGVLSENSNIEVIEGERYGTLSVPSKKGYTFNGWFTEIKGGTEITADSIAGNHKDQTLYAKWTPNKYKVTYVPNANNVKKFKPISKKVTYNTKYGKLPVPKKSGYKFKGWYTKKKGGIKISTMTTMKYAKDIKIYAHWTKNAKIKNCSVVSVRKSPYNNSKILGYVKSGNKISVIKKAKFGWYKVKVGKKTGYIHSKFVKTI